VINSYEGSNEIQDAEPNDVIHSYCERCQVVPNCVYKQAKGNKSEMFLFAKIVNQFVEKGDEQEKDEIAPCETIC
jgi:hypothetical protein